MAQEIALCPPLQLHPHARGFHRCRSLVHRILPCVDAGVATGVAARAGQLAAAATAAAAARPAKGLAKGGGGGGAGRAVSAATVRAATGV